MSWRLINCPRAWEQGPVTIAALKRQEAAARAMGNPAGANVLRAHWEAKQRDWDEYTERHRPAPLSSAKAPELTKIDTQGL